MNKSMQLYLASKSPRRQALLKQIAISFDCIPVDIDETVKKGETPCDYVSRMAYEKADAGWSHSTRINDIPLLAADTSVVLADQILGKPTDKQDAVNMLKRLSRETHQVISCVVVKNSKKIELVTSITDVSFASLSEQQIQYYVNTGDCMDKAGSYGIQGYAACFVKMISGSYSGVVGLPLFETAKLLEKF
jgi:septum formation protein